ncbi:MAG: DUF3108 domain-containing protein [Chthoniobacterales bacterium]
MASIQKSYDGTVRLWRWINFAFAITLSLWMLASPASAQLKGKWLEELTPVAAPAYPDIRPFTATYRFGWSNMLDAATAKVEYTRPQKNAYTIHATGGTVGLVRRLWKIDVIHDASGSLLGCFPAKMNQKETYASQKINMEAIFQRNLSWSLRQVTPSGGGIHKWRKVPVLDLRDMTSAMLFVRSQPMKVGDEIVMTAFPGDSPFLARVHVVGRETLPLNGEKKKVFRLTIELNKINVQGASKGALLPQSKFRKGTIWITDDADRIPVRAEVDIFIGYVYGQLESVQFAP